MSTNKLKALAARPGGAAMYMDCEYAHIIHKVYQ